MHCRNRIYIICLSIGVCDCCDGSDESSNPYISNICPTTLCEAAKSQLKRDALAQYRHIQSSLRARATLLEAYRQKTTKERKSYDELLIEKDVCKISGLSSLLSLYCNCL